MAILHAATLSPTKADALRAWLPGRPWAPPAGELSLLGGFRLDDPEGEVGLEVHLVRLGDVLLQVPLSYRDAPLPGAEDHLVTTMEHSALGARWVYDGLADPVLTAVLAAAALTGTGQALGLVDHDGRRLVVPTPIRIAGGGWQGGPVPVDGCTVVADEAEGAVLRSDRLELRVARRPVAGPAPAVGLTASWPDAPDGVVLVEVSDLGA